MICLLQMWVFMATYMTVAIGSAAKTHRNTTELGEITKALRTRYVETFCGYRQRRKHFSCKTYIPDNLYQGNCPTINDHHFLTFGDMFNNHTAMKGLNSRSISNNIQCSYKQRMTDMSFDKTFTSKVRSLDLSGIGITYLSSRMFQQFKSLEYLNLSSNLISGFDVHFSLGMAKLVEIDLSLSQLTSMDLNWTYHHPSLQYLNLASNRISDIDTAINRSPIFLDVELPRSPYLVIDLTYNNLSCINALSQNLLKQDISIFLEGNPVTCECMKSLSNRTYDNCICDKKLPRNSKEINGQDFCDSFPGIRSTIAMFFLLVVCITLIYHIIYKYGAQRTCYRCQYPSDLIECVINSSDEQIYENHAYIVCDDRDAGKQTEIIYQLQTKRNMKLVCDENALGNQNLLSYIEQCLATSKRTLFVISSYFLDNKLCLYVLSMAATIEFFDQRCVIIILKVKPFSKDQEELISKLTYRKIYYEYPGEQENTDLFWDSLAEAMNDSKLHFKVLGIKAPDHRSGSYF